MNNVQPITINITSKEAIKDGLITLCDDIKTRIDILSSHLPSDVFDDEDLIKHISQHLRNNRMAHARILMSDSSKLLRQRHVFLELIRKLPSKIQVRKLNKDDTPLQHGFILIDTSKHLHQPNLKMHKGTMSIRCKDTVRKLNDEFLMLWGRSRPDENFKQWII